MRRVYVPGDAAARAVGADAVAQAFEAEARLSGQELEVVRTGSRGHHSLEPLVEFDTAEGRVGFGPVGPGDVAELLRHAGAVPVATVAASAPGATPSRAEALALGRVDALPFLAKQTRLTFARCGVTDPLSLEDYAAGGGLVGLERARALGPLGTLVEVERSGLRGRGGAGFPTGTKWRTVRDAPGQRKVIVCNADEGDSGTFADRMLIEGDPYALLEGMAIAAIATGAEEAWVYLRSEYPDAARILTAAIERSGGFGLPVHLRIGGGSYVCGEETALLESLEGRRGQVRPKPPLPAHRGLFGRPTVVNNVLSLGTVPWILANGGEAYAAIGTGRSRGTLVVQLAGNVKNGGLVEVPFGLTLGELIDDFGGGTRSGRPVKAAQVGGPLGAWFPRALFDTPLDFEAFAARGGLVGHGGVVVADDTVDLAAMAEFAFAFASEESCGKCTPCRIGSVRGRETVARIRRGERVAENLALVGDLCHTLEFGSLCALGGFLPYPVRSAIQHFPEDFTGAPGRPGGPVLRGAGDNPDTSGSDVPPAPRSPTCP